MGQDTKDELVKTGADAFILPQRKRILFICMTEACNQVCWPKVIHPSSYLTAVILKIICRGKNNIIYQLLKKVTSVFQRKPTG